MIYGYKKDGLGWKLAWKVFRHQRNPGRFTEEMVETGRTETYYTDICGYTSQRTLLRFIRKMAKDHDIRLSRKPPIQSKRLDKYIACSGF